MVLASVHQRVHLMSFKRFRAPNQRWLVEVWDVLPQVDAIWSGQEVPSIGIDIDESATTNGFFAHGRFWRLWSSRMINPLFWK